jgi:hypothetical protein
MSDKGFFATLRQESAAVPGAVRKFAKFLLIAGSVIFACFWLVAAILFFGQHRRVDELFVGALAIPIASTALAGYIMLVGYVYGDARRRGMPAALWTLLVVLIPNMIGFIVYFILRRGIFAPCANCGRGAEVGQIYCSQCGHKLELAAASPQPAQ